MAIANMTKYHVIDSASSENVFVEFQKARKFIVRDRHVGPDLSLSVSSDKLIHRNRQSMSKLTHLFAVRIVSRKPRPVDVSIMFFEQLIPSLENCVFGCTRRFLLKKYCPGHAAGHLWKFL